MFGQLYAMALEAFHEGYKNCPFTDECLREGWMHGWNNADRDAQEENRSTP